jgi:glycosyltransferase involved in cell wall biosynthesis
MAHVALLHPTYWPEVRRGTERYIHDVAARLGAGGHDLELITSHPGASRRERVDGLAVTFNRRPPDAWLRRRRFDDFWTQVPAALRSLRAGGFDLAHAFYPTEALAATYWRGGPTIFSVMGIPNPLIRIRLDSQPRAARRSAVTTVDSRAVADAFFYRWGLETEVVYPGVDLEAFAPAARAERPTIFCPAPLEVARKRVQWLVDALPAVRRERPDARLVLMRPRDRAVAERLAAQSPGIEFFDAVQRSEDLAPLYGAAWATALPSWGEAFGMVLAESLACGTPVVAANRDAFGEIVTSDAVGRLFDDADRETSLPAALLEALELARDPATAGATRARAQDFSVERTAGAFEALYARLLG